MREAPRMSRRHLLLRVVPAGLAASAVPGGVVAALLLNKKPGATAHEALVMTRATFTPHVNDPFDVRAGQFDSIPLTLAEVRDLPRGRRGSDSQFLVRFKGPVAQPLEQGTHRFSHASVGEFLLFTVPIERPRRGVQTYEAVINRAA